MNVYFRLPDNTSTKKFIFGRYIRLDPDKRYEVAVVKVNLKLNYTNISTALGNATFRYSSNGGTTFKSGILPDGFYSLNELNNEILFILSSNGDNPNGIYFSPMTQNFKMRVVLMANYQWDATVGFLYQILGFNNQVFTLSSISLVPPTLNLGIESIYIGTNLTKFQNYVNEVTSIDDNYFNTTNYIFSAQLLLIPSANINVPVPFPIWTEILQATELTHICLSIKDQNDKNILFTSGEIHLSCREIR